MGKTKIMPEQMKVVKNHGSHTSEPTASISKMALLMNVFEAYIHSTTFCMALVYIKRWRKRSSYAPQLTVLNS